MAKVSFRMASASRESVFGVQTSTARKDHHSGPPRASRPRTPGSAPYGEEPVSAHRRVEPVPSALAEGGVPNTGSVMCAGEGTTTGTAHAHVCDTGALTATPAEEVQAHDWRRRR